MEDLVIPFCDLHRHTLTELLEIVKVNITNIMAFINFLVIFRRRQKYMKAAFLKTPRINMMNMKIVKNFCN